MNANRKPHDSVASVTPAPSTCAVGSCGRPVGSKTRAGKCACGLESEPLVRAPGALPNASADEEVEPDHDAAALAREARLMRLMSLACRWTFVVVAVLWLLATAFPPRPASLRPAPAPRLAPGAFDVPPGCVRSSKDNKLYGRAIMYDHDGRAMFRRVTPLRSLDAPQELISTGGAPPKRR